MTDAPYTISSIARGDTLTDQAEASLRQALISGGFAPGESLTIRALATMLNISVTPAKDAIIRLIAERVMEWGPRRTALVPELTLESIHEIYTIRLALESTAAVCAMPFFDEEALAELQEISDELEKMLSRGDYKNVLKNNHDFHFAIYRRANLPILLGIIEGMWLRMGPSLNLLYQNSPTKEWARAGIGFHQEIIDAIRSGDEASIRAHVLADLTNGRDRLEAAVASASVDRTLREIA